MKRSSRYSAFRLLLSMQQRIVVLVTTIDATFALFRTVTPTVVSAVDTSYANSVVGYKLLAILDTLLGKSEALCGRMIVFVAKQALHNRRVRISIFQMSEELAM